jgi:flagellar biogenesis protein FliO
VVELLEEGGKSMEFLKYFIEVFKELGAGNTALIVLILLFVWFFVKILPQATERIVKAIENLGKVFAAHEERSVSIQNDIKVLQLDVKDLQGDVQKVLESMMRKEEVGRIHDRLDNMATREDIAIFTAALRDHSDDCRRANERILDKVIKE